MSSTDVRVIDTQNFDAVKDLKAELISDYDRINSEYDRIIRTLSASWDGKGADAFNEDAEKIKTNISGIYDILQTMCDTLTDCREVIAMSDHQIGESNANPFEEG